MFKYSIRAGALLLLGLSTALAQVGNSADASAVAAIRELNRKYIETGKRMDNVAFMALWADDAVDLLAGM